MYILENRLEDIDFLTILKKIYIITTFYKHDSYYDIVR